MGRGPSHCFCKCTQYAAGPPANELARYFAAADLRKDARLRKRFSEDRLKVALDNFAAAAQQAGLTRLGDWEILPRPINGVGKGLDAFKRLKKIHPGSPVQVTHFPPRSDNAHWDEVRADDGAELAHEAIDAERQRAGVRPKPTLATSPYTASRRALQALETMNDGGKDPTVEAIKISQRIPHPLVPGALHVSPNRDDALRRCS